MSKIVWLTAGIKVEIPSFLKEGSFIYFLLIDIYVNNKILWLIVSIWLGHRVPKYLVKCYSEWVCEDIYRWD